MEPSLLKSLRLLRETKEPLTEEDLVERTKEDLAYVKGALGKLVDRGVIAKHGEFYQYRQTHMNEEFFRKIQAVYEKAIRKPKIELIVRGLLSDTGRAFPCYRHRAVLMRGGVAMPYLFRLKTLLKLLEDEGFDSEQVLGFLKEEMESGWLGKFEFYIGSEDKLSLLIPSCLPFYALWFGEGSSRRTYGETREMELVVIYHGKGPSRLAPYLSKLRHMSSEELEQYKGKLRERWRELGWFIQEEVYLVGEYPFELASPAREYLEKEKPELGKTIADESYRRWFVPRI
jgi:hypothetical protein